MALFDLARESKQLDAVSASLASLNSTLAESPDLQRLTSSPLVTRDEAKNAAAATAQALKLDPLTANFLGVLAHNRRLGQLAPAIRAFTTLAAAQRGETTAEVVSAHKLDDDQIAALKAKLKKRIGSDVAISLKVDPAILGGLIVKVGSQRIDGSIRTKLNTLAIAMKG